MKKIHAVGLLAVLQVFTFACGERCQAGVLFPLVEEGRPRAAFRLPDNLRDTDAKQVREDIVAFNGYLKQVTGAELSIGGAADLTIEVVLNPITNILTQFDWCRKRLNDRILRIEATSLSLMLAFVDVLEEGCDARFLGTEKCMFQFEPRKNVALSNGAKTSNSNGYRMLRDSWHIWNHKREMGFTGGGLSYAHGLPFVAFPYEKYNKEGWPSEIMPIIGGKKLLKPRVRSAQWQPCYSNPRTAEIAVANIRVYLQTHPDVLSISLGVNDSRGYCECENCTKMNADAERPIWANDRGNCSPSYYTFVNRVAEALEKDYPELKIGLLAYSGTIMPPPFPVHRNVVPMMTFDLLAASQEDAAFRLQQDIIRRWHEKVPFSGTWDYYWGRQYLMPRVNFLKQAERIRFLHDNGGEAYFGEGEPDMSDGPKLYLTSRLIADANADPEAILSEWYERFAGKSAAPVLRGLFDKCRDYWYTSEMRRSPYYPSRNFVYAYPSEISLYAMTVGFTQELLSDARKVAALANTAGERKRAEILVHHFEMLDCHVAFAGYAYRDSGNGEFASAEIAAKSLGSTSDRWGELLSEWDSATAYFQHPDYDGKAAERYIKGDVGLDLGECLRKQVFSAASFSDDPAVGAALNRLAGLPSMPESVCKLVDTFGSPGENVFVNPEFARPISTNEIETTLTYEITDEVLYKGQKTLKVWPGRYKGLPNPKDNVLFSIPTLSLLQKVQKGSWLGSVAIMSNSEGKGVDIQVWCRRGVDYYHWSNVSYTQLKKNEWHRFARAGSVLGKCDGLGLIFRMTEDFGPDDVIYIGGIGLFKMD